MSGASITAEPPPHAAPETSEPGRWRRYALAAGFAPAFVLLIVWVVYPTIYTIVQSLYGGTGFGNFVGFDNYKTLFTTDIFQTAIKSNAIWVAVGARDGLVFAVLIERISWSVALQDGRVHADGDLRLRGGDHVADHVREGSRSVRSTRRSSP